MDYPKNYEEAKKIIIESNNDKDFNNSFLKRNRLREGLVAGLFMGTSVVLGLIQNNPEFITAGLPFAGIATLASMIPSAKQLITMKRIKDGSFFEGKSEQEIIDVAKKVVATYNYYLENKGRSR